MAEVLKTISTRIEAYRIELPCEEEGCDGMIESCGTLAKPPQYPHKCTKCGKERNIFGITYPYVARFLSFPL